MIVVDGSMFERQVLALLRQINGKVDKLMSQQDEINADVTELDGAVAALQAEIARLQGSNPTLDLTALKTAVDAVAAIAPPAAPAP